MNLLGKVLNLLLGNNPIAKKVIHIRIPSIIEQIIYRSKLLNILAKINFDLLINLIARLLATQLTVSKPKYKKILVLGRSIFDEDMTEISRHSQSITYIRIDKTFFLTLFKEICPDYVEIHSEFYNIEGIKYSSKLKKYKRIVQNVLVSLNVQGVVSANYNYSWQQSIFDSCNELGLKRIILFKEGISPIRKLGASAVEAMSQQILRYTNNKLNADLLLVYNKTVKESFLKTKIADPSLCEVFVTGIPRFDCFYSMPKPQNHIVFFSFSFAHKADFLNLEPKLTEECLNYMDQFHREVILFATLNKHIDITIKTKSRIIYLDYVEEIFKSLGIKKPSNIKLTNSEPVLDLIKKSTHVIGYNSTTLLQALAAGRKVLSADFSDFPIQDMFAGDQNLVQKVRDAAAIEKAISLVDTSIKKENFDSSISNFLEQRVGPPDGKSALRASNYIESLF